MNLPPALRRELVDGAPLAAGHRLRVLTRADLGGALGLLDSIIAAASATPDFNFLHPQQPEKLAAVLAPAHGQVFGELGMTVGVVAPSGELMGTACLDLHGPVLPIASTKFRNAPMPRSQAGHLRTLAVHPSARRRGYARAMLRARCRVAEALGRCATVEVSLGNMATLQGCFSEGFVIVDVRPDPVYPGQWSWVMANRPGPQRAFSFAAQGRPLRIGVAQPPRRWVEVCEAGYVGVSHHDGEVTLRPLARPSEQRRPPPLHVLVDAEARAD